MILIVLMIMNQDIKKIKVQLIIIYIIITIVIIVLSSLKMGVILLRMKILKGIKAVKLIRLL